MSEPTKFVCKFCDQLIEQVIIRKATGKKAWISREDNSFLCCDGKRSHRKRIFLKDDECLKTIPPKRAFETKDAALVRNNKSSSPFKVKTYKCPWCGMYHLTSVRLARR